MNSPLRFQHYVLHWGFKRAESASKIVRLALLGLGLSGVTAELAAQGCVASRFMSLSLGPDGITRLHAGEWQMGMSYRYLYADEGWRGGDRWPEYATIVGNRITVHSFDLQATYAFSPRLSATFTLPYVQGTTSNPAEHDGTRHEVSARGVGDGRLVGSYWLLDPATNEGGNISIGLGFKAPTGQEAATAIFYKPTGPEVRPVDVSIQPGDGGWGGLIELAGYRRFSPWLYGYANGYYLSNPKETNRAYTTGPVYGQILPVSVSDQYLARAGVSFTRLPWRELTAQIGGRINGVPSRDLIGGSEGFRRPGYAIYVEPGLSWTSGRHSLSLFIPLRVGAKRSNNVYDDRNHSVGGGAFAHHLVVLSYSRTQ